MQDADDVDAVVVEVLRERRHFSGHFFVPLVFGFLFGLFERTRRFGLKCLAAGPLLLYRGDGWNGTVGVLFFGSSRVAHLLWCCLLPTADVFDSTRRLLLFSSFFVRLVFSFSSHVQKSPGSFSFSCYCCYVIKIFASPFIGFVRDSGCYSRTTYGCFCLRRSFLRFLVGYKQLFNIYLSTSKQLFECAKYSVHCHSRSNEHSSLFTL